MSYKKTKLYIGCALTYGVSEDFRRDVQKLKKALSNEGFEVMDFVGLTAGTAADVFHWDINHCVKKCDAFIGICDYPGIGLGYELAEAANLKKPILAVAHTESIVSRLVVGAAETLPNFKFIRYKNLQDEILPMVNSWLEELGLAQKKLLTK